MPRIVKRDPAVAARILRAIEAIENGVPTHLDLQKQAVRGTLRLSPTSVAKEARVKRNQIGGPNCLYADEYATLASKTPAKGSVKPLRVQLDKARADLRLCRGRLAKSRSYAFQILVRMHELEKENEQLREERDNADLDFDEPIIGEGKATVIPPRPTKQGRRGHSAPA